MSPKDADGMANSVAPDQTAHLIWVCTVLFAQAYLSENLGSLRYVINALLTWDGLRLLLLVNMSI